MTGRLQSHASGPANGGRRTGLTPYPGALAAMESRVARSAPEPRRSWSGWSSTRRSTPPGPPRARGAAEGPLPAFAAGRGGQWTYHGPGQRTAYVMLDLTGAGRGAPRDVRRYVWALEEWLIRALGRFNVRAERREGRVGIWVADPAPGRGEDRRDRRAGHPLGDLARHRAERGPDLSHFGGIVPCGISRTRRHQPAAPRRPGDDRGGG